MKYNLRNAIFDKSGAKQLENVGTQSKPQNLATSKNIHTGLTQELQNVYAKEFFHVAPGTILFLPDTADKLYRVQVIENCEHYTKIRYFGWGSEHDAWFNSKSVWAYSKYKEQLCSRRKINTDLSNKIDNLLISCDSTDSSQLNNPFFECVDLSIKSESNKLPEVLTILSSYVPSCRFVPTKFRARWSQLISGILLECVEAPDNETYWQKRFAVSKCVVRANNSGDKKTKAQPGPASRRTF